MNKPTALKSAVLLAILEQLDSKDREIFTLQTANLTVKNRENTGAGFYTHFGIDSNSLTHPLPDLRGLPVEANIVGLSHGVGFILWVKEGRIDCLEGYSYEERTEDLDWEAVEFKLIDLKSKYLS